MEQIAENLGVSGRDLLDTPSATREKKEGKKWKFISSALILLTLISLIYLNQEFLIHLASWFYEIIRKIVLIMVMILGTYYFLHSMYILHEYAKIGKNLDNTTTATLSYLPLMSIKIRIQYHIISSGVDQPDISNYLQSSKSYDLQIALLHDPTNSVPILFASSTLNLRHGIRELRHYQKAFEVLLRSMRFDVIDPIPIPHLRHGRYVTGFTRISSINGLASRLSRGQIDFPVLFSFDFTRIDDNLGVKFSFYVREMSEINIMNQFIRTVCLSPTISRRAQYNQLDPEAFEVLLVFPFISVEEILSLRENNRSLMGVSGNSKTEDVLRERKMGRVTSFFHPLALDFTQGGLITGGIGTGKTTLRLHIMDRLISEGTRIIDIDFKGDAPRHEYFRKFGKVYVPKVNLQLNPFSVPKGSEMKEYVDQLTRALIETIDDSTELSPPQRNLLYEATKMTVRLNGNSRDFFENISQLSIRESQIIDNKQDHTAIALINKFQWLESTMREIFWTQDTNLDPMTFVENNSYIDLSQINDTVPIEQMRFLINLILMNFTIALKSKGEQYKYDKNGNKIPKYAIFLDEGQYLVPRKDTIKKELSRLEEIISTFRYKGVAVIASGVSAELMSTLLTDSGFIAQFRSDSTTLLRALGLSEEISEQVPRLLNFHAFIKGESTNHEPVLIQTEGFAHPKMSEKLYHRSLPDSNVKYLNDFNRGIIDYAYFEILQAVGYEIHRPERTILEQEINALLQSAYRLDLSQLLNLDKNIELICTEIGNIILENSTPLLPLIERYTTQFMEVLFVRLIWFSISASDLASRFSAGLRKQLVLSLSKNYNHVLEYLKSILNTIIVE